MSTPQQIAPQAAAPVGFSRARLWFGLLGGPVAWSAQYALSYPLAARACEGRGLVVLSGMGGWQIVVAAVAIVLAGVALWAGYVAWGTWRAAHHHEPSVLQSDADDRAAFMGMAGVLLSAVFFVGILWNVVTPFVVNTCSEVL